MMIRASSGGQPVCGACPGPQKGFVPIPKDRRQVDRCHTRVILRAVFKHVLALEHDENSVCPESQARQRDTLASINRMVLHGARLRQGRLG